MDFVRIFRHPDWYSYCWNNPRSTSALYGRWRRCFCFANVYLLQIGLSRG